MFDRIDGWIGKTLFIHVDAPTTIARERLGRRSQHSSRFQNADCIDDASLWARGDEVIEHLADAIAAELGRRGLEGRLLRIASDGGDTPLDRARLIRDHLERID